MPDSSAGRSIVCSPRPLSIGDRLAEHRLAVPDQVDEDRLGARAEGGDGHRLAAAVDRLVGADEEVVAGLPARQRHLAPADEPLVVDRLDGPGTWPAVRRELGRRRARGVGLAGRSEAR